MTESQFTKIVQLLQSIDGTLAEINRSIPEDQKGLLIKVHKKLDDIDRSVQDVTLTIGSKH